MSAITKKMQPEHSQSVSLPSHLQLSVYTNPTISQITKQVRPGYLLLCWTHSTFCKARLLTALLDTSTHYVRPCYCSAGHISTFCKARLLTALPDTSAHSVRPGYLLLCWPHQHILHCRTSDQLHSFSPLQALTVKTHTKNSAFCVLSTLYCSYCNGANILTDWIANRPNYNLTVSILFCSISHINTHCSV
jgi:hypothetical protein